MTFQRTIGAAADQKELCYIAALHQTCFPETRSNGTISSHDVQRLLVSRYRLHVSHLQCIQLLRSLGGGGGSSQTNRVRIISKGNNQRSFKLSNLMESRWTKGKTTKGKDDPTTTSTTITKNSNRIQTKNESLAKDGLSQEMEEGMSSVTVNDETNSIRMTEKGMNTMERFNDEDDDNDDDDDNGISAKKTNTSSFLNQTKASFHTNDVILDSGVFVSDKSFEKEGNIHTIGVPETHHPRNKNANDNDANDDAIPEEYLDLVQIMAILLIPTFARAAQTINLSSRESEKNSPMVSHFDVTDENTKDESLNPQPTTLLNDGLRFLLKNISVDMDDTINVELIEAILLENGEYERAQDQQLMQEMVHAASTESNCFNVDALAKALTSDLDAWDIGSEDRWSTYAEDVFGMDPQVAMTKEDPPRSQMEPKPNIQKGAFSMSSIDYVVDTHTSVVIHCLIWSFYFFTSITFGSILQSTVKVPCKDTGTGTEFGCQLKVTLWTWLVYALFLSAFGYTVILPLSYGNNPSKRSLFCMIPSILTALSYAIIPYAITMRYKQNIEEPYNNVEETINNRYFEPLLHVTVIVGLSLSFCYIIQILISAFSNSIKKDRFKFLVATSNTVGERRSKLAGTRKINRILLNAHCLHSDDPGRPTDSLQSITNKTEMDQTMLNFVLRGAQHEYVGGLLWTFRILFTGKLFDTEGIWLPTRLIVFQVAQVLTGIVLIGFFFNVTSYAVIKAETAQQNLDPNLPSWVKRIVPTRKAIMIALYPASAVASIVVVSLILLYIPSAITTLLQYRCGLLPSLGSHSFKKFRSNVDTAHMNTGNALYGLVGASLLFYVLVGLSLFLFTYEATRDFMIRILAWGLGLTITIVAKMLLVKTCRSTLYRSFFRIRPRSADYTSLGLECWFIGLGSSVLVGRITQFLVAAVFWVGRIDVSFLSENVSLMGYAFDYVPTNFSKDLLQHEAHRHPYIERLAQMYLMKFRHPEFNTSAGAVWRQLFVLSLMPWMRKSRVFSNIRVLQAIEALARIRLEAEEDTNGVTGRLGEDIMGIQAAFMEVGSDVVGGLQSSAEKTIDSVNPGVNLVEETFNSTLDMSKRAADTGIQFVTDVMIGVTGKAIKSAQNLERYEV